MVAETEIICQQSVPAVMDVQYHLRVSKDQNLKVDVASPSTPMTFESISTQISVSLFVFSSFLTPSYFFRLCQFVCRFRVD
uniref:Uncharacterized protein n=1 Tax=Rhizophora mucronata TaxID=61149 RepID=A0A2P2KJD1_RHIMU